MLYALAQQPVFTPVKYFSIDRVFRNEAMDATHLAEFHQIEGLVADYDLTLADLMGIIGQFFSKWGKVSQKKTVVSTEIHPVLGFSNLRYKPAYNPYTEPSMEIFGYHTQLKKWVEIGNSGVFRPEMLLPLGLDPKVRVIAWGLSLERYILHLFYMVHSKGRFIRPTMIRYGISNIRDLVGHKVDFDFITTNPLCDIQLDDVSA